MNNLALGSGIALAIGLLAYFKLIKREQHSATYAYLLLSFPFYYFCFALYAGDYKALWAELIVGAFFWIITLISLSSRGIKTWLLLSMGFIAHGAYDVIHHLMFNNQGTPIWWPEFCGSIDFILGLYLLLSAIKFKTHE